ncbi:transposable element Tc3 transposase [Trichonephila clavipes]|nr:transposable element Tc3 transposase [Trichonephila clavipes]
MTPIEHVGDSVGRRIDHDPQPSASKDELLLRIQAIWNSVPQADIQNLFDSMPLAKSGYGNWNLSPNLEMENRISHQILKWKREFVIKSGKDGDRFNTCQVIYPQFGLAIYQNGHQARRRFVEWAQNEIAVVPDFHKRILISDEAHFWLNGYVNKQNCRIWSEANPQVYVETPLHPEKLTVWCALWAGGILQKR